MIKNTKVMLFSRTNDPKCDMAKYAFATYDIDYSIIELDQVPEGQKLMEELKSYIPKAKLEPPV